MVLREKILSGFLILTMMLAVAGVWSIHELTAVGTSVQSMLDDNYKSINAGKMMIEALERERIVRCCFRVLVGDKSIL